MTTMTRPTPLSTAARSTVTIVRTAHDWIVFAGTTPIMYYDMRFNTIDDVRGLVAHMRARGHAVEGPEEVVS